MAPFAQVPYEQVPDAPRIAHQFWESTVRTVSIAQGEIHLRVFGAGPPLLLVHGLMTTCYSWRYVLPRLGERFTLYMPDLLGAGRSAKPDIAYHPDVVADAVGATMDALGISGCSVIGNSLGGYLCMRLAMRRPTLIGRLVNLHSPGLPTARNYALAAAYALAPMSETILRRLVWRHPQRWVHKNVHYIDDTLKSREEHEEFAAPLRTREGVTAFSRMLSQTLAPGEMRRFRAALAGLQGRFPVPLRLVYAEYDPLVPAAIGRALHALLPSAECVWLRDASHFAHVDAPDRFIDAVSDFL